MQKEKYSILVKKHKEEASDFVTEQEVVVKLLNSPVRRNWLKIIGLKSADIKKAMKIVGHYAKLKVSLENRKKPKTRKEIILIEDACLRLMFQARIYDFNHLKTRFEKLKALEKILPAEYKGSVILNTYQAEKLAVLSESKNEAADFLVFDSKKNKIIAIDAEKH